MEWGDGGKAVRNRTNGRRGTERMFGTKGKAASKDVSLSTTTSGRRFERQRQIQGQLIFVGLRGKLHQTLIQGQPRRSSQIAGFSSRVDPPHPHLSLSYPESSQVQVQESPNAAWFWCASTHLAHCVSGWPSALGRSPSLPQSFPSPLSPLHHTHSPPVPSLANSPLAINLHICLAQTQITLQFWVVASTDRLLDRFPTKWRKSILTEEFETKHALEQVPSIHRKHPSIRDLPKGFTVHGTERSNGTKIWSTSSNLPPLTQR